MIGNTYLVRSQDRNDPLFYCIKRMMGKAMAEKDLYSSVRKEIQILAEVTESQSCCSLVDIVYDTESLGLVFPFYPHGDLHSFTKSANRHRRLR